MAARFWVGGNGDWSDTTHWSAASGGTSGASVPTTADSATFNSASALAGSALVVSGSGDVGELDAAPPTSGSLTFSGSYINIEPLVGTTSTISAGVTLPSSLYFGSYSVGTQTLSISSTTSTSTDILIYGKVGSTPVVSGTMNIRSLRVWGDYLGSGVSSVTFSSANITATNGILVDDGPYPLTNVTLTSSTFNAETVRFQGNATYTGSGNTLRSPSTGYNTINWSYPTGVVFPGLINAVFVNSTSQNNVFPSGTITVTDSSSFVYNHYNIAITPPRCGAVVLTRSSFTLNNMGTFPCGTLTFTNDATAGSSLNVNGGYTDCGTVSAVAPITAPHYLQKSVVSSGSVTLTNCVYDSGSASSAGIQVSGANTIAVSSSTPATGVVSFTGTITAGTGLVSFSNVYPLLINNIDTTGAVNINNSTVPNSASNYIYASSPGLYKFASGIWTDIPIDAAFASIQTTGAFTISHASTLAYPVVNFGYLYSNIIGGAFSVTTSGNVSITSLFANLTFSSTAAFINTGWSANNSNWVVSTGSSYTLTHTGALTVTGARINASSGSVVYSSTITINSNTTGGYGSYTTDGNPYTFGGAITVNAGTLSGVSPGGNQFSIGQVFNNTSLVSISSTGLSNATPNVINLNAASSAGYFLSFSGNSALTDTTVTIPNLVWKNTGANTLTVSGAAGNNTPLTFSTHGLWMNTGAASFTNTNVSIASQFDDGTGNFYSVKSGAAITVTGATTTSSGVEFSAPYAVLFVAGTLATWTDVKISVGNFFANTTFTVNGAGGFTLAGAAKNSEIASPYCSMSVNGPTSLTVGALGTKDITLNSLGSGGTLGVTGLGLDSEIYLGSVGSSAISATGAATFSNISLRAAGGSLFVSTFNWSSTALNNNFISLSESASQTSQFNTTATITNVSSCGFYLLNAQAFNVTGLGNGSTFTVTDTGSTSTFGGAASFTNINYLVYGAATFTSTFGWTSTIANANTIYAGIFGGTTTFTGAATIANCVIMDFTGPVGCGANLSISGTALIDHKNSSTYVAIFRNNLNVNAAATTTFTNVRPYLAGTNSLGLVTLATNGGIYLGFTTTTISGALSSSGASTFFPIEGESNSVLVLNGAVTLVNANLKVATITVAGGATKNFAYSLSSPVPDDRVATGILSPYNYPEIAFDTFTLTNTGGTFSIAGGGAANLRTLISPFNIQNGVATAAMNVAVNPTFTDVDFWRIVPGGASTKPWTGTRLGNVGTLTNITTATPKTVYWVGGGGSWGGNKWATSSGGAGSAANYPLPQDTAYFDASSGIGNVTLPASVRFKDFVVAAVSAGTTAVYTAAPDLSNSVTNMLMSGSFYGPANAVGTFIFGNDSTYNFGVQDSSAATSQINLIVADSSASDTHTIATQNLQFMPFGGLKFASLGTTTVTNDIINSSGNELSTINSYSNADSATRVVNFTCNQVGRTTTSTDWSAFSSYYLFSFGTFNFGSCTFGAATCSTLGATIANTPYTVIVSYAASMPSTTTPAAGNLIAIFNIGGAGNFVSIDSSVSGNSYKNISTVGASSASLIRFDGSVDFSCYSFLVDGPLELRGLPSNKSLIKIGGGVISLPGVKVTPTGTSNRLNASPANTWYAPGGTVGSGSTGWSTSAVSTNTGGFLMF